MQYKMPNGTVGEPQALTDLEHNNRLLAEQTKILKMLVMVLGFVGGGFLVVTIWTLYTITKYNILTNIVRACIGGG